MNEFELIRTYFATQAVQRDDVRVGIGDDAAVVAPPSGMETAITTDVLVSGVHFFPHTEPAAIGHKSLAVNLSDLAALGAEPAWFLLDLTLPEADMEWLRGFAEGLFSMARRYNVQLIGGDTARGPLAIGISAIGFVPPGGSLRRSGARVGDVIYVTGTLGDAALALAQLSGTRRFPTEEWAVLRNRLERPMPRVAEGMALRGLASSAIDISDGLLADLGHILEASAVGARLELGRIPLSEVYRAHVADIGWDFALAGGDDYELCFTVPAAGVQAVEALAREQNFALTAIGEIKLGRKLDVRDPRGKAYLPKSRGYDHFTGA